MKKAQAAMEFLMTYGFAIIMVIVAIAALSYFGVLTSRAQPRKCDFPAGMDCIDAQITESSMVFVLKNNLGSEISIYDIVPSACVPANKQIATPSNSPYKTLPVTVPNNQALKINLTCDHNAGSHVKESVEISYIHGLSGISHKAKGDIIDNVI